MYKWIDFNLRKIQKSDLGIVLEWRNSERIRKNMYTEHIISLEEHQEWYSRLQKADDKISLIFEYKNQPIGLVSFTEIDNYNSTAFWGFYIGQATTLKGMGRIMGILGIEYAFQQIKICKLCGEAIAFNIGSINFHSKLGFKEEGEFGKKIFKNGQYQDIIRFTLFQEEWAIIGSSIKESVFTLI